MVRKILIAVVVLLAAATFGVMYIFHENPVHRLQEEHVRVGDQLREFCYYRPGDMKGHPKLIFALHGSTGTPKVMQISTGHEFDALANRYGDAIIVYPAGYHHYWNDCRKQGTYDAKKENIDDVAFFGAMIKWFKDKYDIDTTEVFALGHSNGGHMCYKLAKEKPQWFRGIAAISASLPEDANNDCYESRLPVSVLVMNGTSDPINPYKGGEVIAGDGQKRGSVISTEATVDYWVKNDSCDTQSITYNFPDVNTADNSTVVQYTYSSLATGKKVVLVKVVNGGHVIPNPGFKFWPRQLGNVNKDIDAPQIIWDFFHQL